MLPSSSSYLCNIIFLTCSSLVRSMPVRFQTGTFIFIFVPLSTRRSKLFFIKSFVKPIQGINPPRFLRDLVFLFPPPINSLLSSNISSTLVGELLLSNFLFSDGCNLS